MESVGKQGSPDAPIEENDRVGKDTATATAKRSYKCTFCKRGFTNGQALGGHMNIHRKDRAKARKQTSSTVPIRPMNEESMNPRYVPTIPTHENGPVNLQAQVSNPRIPYGYYDRDFLAYARPQSFSINEELLGPNLRLRIGTTIVDDNEMMMRGIMKEDEIDLELRLGHDP
ncbi:Detected protein of unknown function [Hibiscus syriacus]|uniref:C2H2-type domain-containing protein n=1 Tax=Hibiscus syriacus TaxID=106335 RepID=A0A6A3CBF1_HIBSY|nr:transcriptional regulator TAC1-like [Hibiscus syriacus]KAE8725917.1 Detected protein of unknown function [Hibiscus syriacus]